MVSSCCGYVYKPLLQICDQETTRCTMLENCAGCQKLHRLEAALPHIKTIVRSCPHILSCYKSDKGSELVSGTKMSDDVSGTYMLLFTYGLCISVLVSGTYTFTRLIRFCASGSVSGMYMLSSGTSCLALTVAGGAATATTATGRLAACGGAAG